MLKISNLYFSYKNTSILDNINLFLEKGKIYFLLGENGAGKTTLIKCILNILNYKKGTIEVGQKDIKLIDSNERAKLLSYVPQEHTPLFNHLLLDVILMGAAGRLNFYESPKKSDIERANMIARYLGIEKLISKGYGEISGGERQLTLIGRALMQDSKFLLMDEPHSNLDYGNRIMVMNILENLKKDGYTILISSHNPQDAFLYADEVIILNEGKVKVQGPPNDVLTSELLSSIYKQNIELIDIKEKNIKICIPITKGETK